MALLIVFCRLFVFIYYVGMVPAQMVSALETSTPDATMDELPAIITAAPELSNAILQKRNISGSSIWGLNYIEGWSQIGKTQEPFNPSCNGGLTAAFFSKGNQLIQTCVMSGAQTTSLDFTTACLDYQTQGYAQMQSGIRYCTDTAPYCAKYLWDASPSTYSAFGCMNKNSLTFGFTKTGAGPPYSTSTLNSSPVVLSATVDTAITPAPSSTGKTPAPSSSSTGVNIAANVTSAPSATNMPTQSGLPPGIIVAAAIFGTLGGVGILVVGALIYIYLKRKRRQMEAAQLRHSQKSIDDDVKGKKSLESPSFASTPESVDRNRTASALRNSRVTSSEGENQTSLAERVAEEEAFTFFELASSFQNEYGTLEEFVGSEEEEEIFKWDLKIIDAQSTFRNATALLDTQCQIGNWISHRLVNRLDKLASISKSFTPPDVSEASGKSVSVIGTIELEWKRSRGNSIHQTQFYVYSTTGEIDVIFGVEYIVKERLLEIRDNALIPLIPHKKAKKETKAAIALAKEKQRQEQAALEARRAEEAAQSQSQG